MWSSQSLVGKPSTRHPDIAESAGRGDAAERMTDSSVASIGSKTNTRAVGLLWPGAVSGLAGLSLGCLVGVFVPGPAYRIVTIVVASLTALAIGWHLDRMTAALRRLAGRSQG